eukprot:sb/3476634/
MSYHVTKKFGPTTFKTSPTCLHNKKLYRNLNQLGTQTLHRSVDCQNSCLWHPSASPSATPRDRRLDLNQFVRQWRINYNYLLPVACCEKDIWSDAPLARVYASYVHRCKHFITVL